MIYLHPKQITYLYQQILNQSGGTFGLRDQGLLESAIVRPQASFGGHDLYPDIHRKAAALFHSLIKNHPFVDGNKRVAFEAMRLFLRLNDWDIKASADAKVSFVMDVAAGKLNEEAIATWIEKTSHPYK